MPTRLLLRQNLDALIQGRPGITQHDVAFFCHHSDPWLSAILRGERDLQIKDVDRIAEFFGIAPYQLFQPGISSLTERRIGDRRVGRDRRIGHQQRTLHQMAAELDRASPRGTGTKRRAETEAVVNAATVRRFLVDTERRLNHLMAPSEPGGQTAPPRAVVAKTRRRRGVVGGPDSETP